MDNKRNVLWILGVLLLVGVALILFMNTGSGQPSTTTEYSSATYGYSFVYPASYSINEYTPEMQTIQDPDAEDVHDLASVVVRSSLEGDSFTDFDSFVEKDATIFCAADGPDASMYCTSFASKESFRSAGENGLEFYLNREVRDASGVASSTWGPIFAFPLPKAAPPDGFAALYVVPPLSFPGRGEATAYPELLARTIRLVN